MPKQKILMFGWEFPPYNTGGLGVACLGLTKALVKEGVDIQFVLPYRFALDYKHIDFLFADTSRTVSLKEYTTIKKLINPYSFWSHVYSEDQEITTLENSDFYGGDIYLQTRNYLARSYYIIKQTEFDVIHCHDWLTIEAGIIAKKLTGKPLVFHIHATEIDRTGGQGNDLIYNIEQLGLQEADTVVVVSEFTKQTILENYEVDPDKIQVVHNGIDYYLESSKSKDLELLKNLESLKKDLGYKLVTYVGRLTFQKGVEYFLEAAKIVLRYSPKTKFIIAGTGDMEEYLLELIAKNGLSTSVILTGFLREEKLRSVYAVSDLFIMPSVYEPFGLVALESLVHETPTIVSKSAGVGEVLSHVLKVDFWDTEEISHLILSILKYETLHYQLKNYGRDEVKKISWEASARKIQQVYQKLFKRQT